MVTIAPATRTFAGTSAQQEHAAELFRLMQSVGRFMSVNAPIRLTLDSAAEFFADKKISRDALVAAIQANPDSFHLDESGEKPVIIATRAGTLSGARRPDTSHDFATRLMTPAPKPEVSDQMLRPRPRMESGWSIFDVQTTDLDARPNTSLAGGFALTQPVEEAIAEAAEAEIDAVAAAESFRTITVPAAQSAPTDVSDASDTDLEAALIERLGAGHRIAMADAVTPRLGALVRRVMEQPTYRAAAGRIAANAQREREALGVSHPDDPPVGADGPYVWAQVVERVRG